MNKEREINKLIFMEDNFITKIKKMIENIIKQEQKAKTELKKNGRLL